MATGTTAGAGTNLASEGCDAAGNDCPHDIAATDSSIWRESATTAATVGDTPGHAANDATISSATVVDKHNYSEYASSEW